MTFVSCKGPEPRQEVLVEQLVFAERRNCMHAQWNVLLIRFVHSSCVCRQEIFLDVSGVVLVM